MTEKQGADLVKAGAALSLAGCNLMLIVPLLLIVGVMLWCSFSLLFS